MGISLLQYMEQGAVIVQPVDPAELSPGELVHNIRNVVKQGARVVVLDSINGYLNAMPEERFLAVYLHELLTYLGQQGVATVLVGAHQGIIGPMMTTPVEASYLADTVFLLRYYEYAGEVRQALSVVKKRGGRHERSVREMRLNADGIWVGEPLRHFRGVLTGEPTIVEPRSS
jgi:circadian clock protein KaiC